VAGFLNLLSKYYSRRRSKKMHKYDKKRQVQNSFKTLIERI
jgi:hypothetical protein